MQQDDSFYFQAIEFARRGYAVVVPTREGFGSSGGTYFRANCDLTEGARHWANSVQAAIGKEAQAKATKACEERGGVGCQSLCTRQRSGLQRAVCGGGKDRCHAVCE